MPRRVNKKGVTYIEVLIALAVFSIAVIPLFPALSKAGKDAAAARDGYAARLTAQDIMLLVKEAAEENRSPEPSVEAYAAGLAGRISAYGYWIFADGGENEIYLSPDAPDTDVSAVLTGLPIFAHGEGYIIAVAVWTRETGIIGRAVGIANREK